MEFYSEPQALEAYLNIPLKCRCGRIHYAPVKRVTVGENALEQLPRIVAALGYRKPFIACDPVTYRIAGERCAQLLEAAGVPGTVHILSHLKYDEATLGELVISIPADADVMIAVGTGSITDMTRYMTYKLKLPCITVATGAPMDGFAASIGIVNVNNLKCTMPAHNTEAIIGDTGILAGAPYRMTAAGFGDLIGKVSCLNDWELSAVVNGEHICPDMIRLVRSCVDEVLREADHIPEKNPAVLGKVMNGLVLSGTAISLYGDSRPASGAEHHMSHFWESLGDQRGKDYAMHGEQVAVATVVMLMLGEELLSLQPDFAAAREKIRSFDYAAWEVEIRRVYGLAAEEVLAVERKAGKNRTDRVLARIDSMEQHWDEIKTLLSARMPAEELTAKLRLVGMPAVPEEIGIGAELLRDTICYAKETRARYTLLQLIWDLGLAEPLADRVVRKLYAE